MNFKSNKTGFSHQIIYQITCMQASTGGKLSTVLPERWGHATYGRTFASEFRLFGGENFDKRPTNKI